jgi:hypothetical protein
MPCLQMYLTSIHDPSQLLSSKASVEYSTQVSKVLTLALKLNLDPWVPRMKACGFFNFLSAKIASSSPSQLICWIVSWLTSWKRQA